MTATATTYNPRYRYGDSKPHQVPWQAGGGAGTQVNTGDLVFRSMPTRTVTDAGTTNTSTNLTSASALFTPGDVGAAVSGSGIPANTTIVSVQSSTSVTMSANATATASNVSVTITPVYAGTVYQAQQYPWTTNLSTTQANFVKQFIGVAAQQFDGVTLTAYGINDGTLRVDTDGVFDFSCASATWAVGDLVGVAQDGANNNLAGQTVVNVNSSGVANAIGRCVKAGTNLTTVRVQIFSAATMLANAGAI